MEALHQIEQELSKKRLPRAQEEWGGADVVILKKPRSYMPDTIRFVITDHALELSWFIEALRDAFYAEGRLDGCSKIEFFGRLANAAQRCLQCSGNPTAHQICAAVLHEAFGVYAEMEEGAFEYYGVALGNEIADDHANNTPRIGYVDDDDTRVFFKGRGINIP